MCAQLMVGCIFIEYQFMGYLMPNPVYTYLLNIYDL